MHLEKGRSKKFRAKGGAILSFGKKQIGSRLTRGPRFRRKGPMLPHSLRCAALVLACLGLGLPLSAQVPMQLSNRAQLSLLTLSPGDEIHTLFGHGTLRVLDPAQELDVSFNYGTFDFDTNFVPRFIYGELDYYLSVQSTPALLQEAHSKGRNAYEQVLNLNARQRQELFAALFENSQPENRVFRYDFLFDNCSTRLVKIMEAALGEDLLLPQRPAPDSTFRELLSSHLGAKPWMQFGVDLLIGASVDCIATDRENWFLPAKLMEALNHSTIDGRPLVKEFKTIQSFPRPELPPKSWDSASALMWILFALGALQALAGKRSKFSDRIDGTLLALIGFVGLFLLLMWVGTLHHVTADNWNVAWAWPTHLIVAVFVFRGSTAPLLRIYLVLAALAAVICAFGVGIPQTLPTAAQPLCLLLAARYIALQKSRVQIAAPA